jgi:hypothetical protein
VATRTCPNSQCTYDDKLEPGQHCPLCGKEAQEFSLSEFGNLLKEKDNFRKSIEKKKERKALLQRIKFCAKCGSTNITFPIFYRPSIWKCLDCGYEGPLIIEDGEKLEKK